MKGISIAALALLIAGPALAGGLDDGKRGSTRDLPPEPARVDESVIATRSGIYISGSLGLVVDSQRSVSTRVNRENGDIVDEGTEEAPALVDLPQHLSSYGVNWDDDDLDAKVFGGDISYLFQMPGNRRFAIEIGAGVTGYKDAKTTHSYDKAVGNYSMIEGEPVQGDNPTPGTSAGSVTFDRKYDLDLVLLGHYFLRDNWSLYGGGGVSWAHGELRSNSGNVNLPFYDTKNKEDVDSLGFVIVAGTRVWVTDSITLGVEYNYKNHTFDASGGTRTEYEGGTPFGYSAATEKSEVEDDLHIAKVKAGFHF